MRSYKTSGIVIKRKNFGEADRLITIFSREKGKIRLLAKGARKPLSKMAGHLGQMNTVSLVVAKGRNLDIITSAEAINSYDQKSLHEISEMFSTAEIVDRFLGENDPHPKAYDLLEEVLYQFPNDLALAYFKLNFLKEIGFGPELYDCVKCSSKLEEHHNGFDINDGGVVCHNCTESFGHVANDTIKLMRLALDKKWDFLSKLEPVDSAIEELKLLTGQMLSHKISSHLKSEKFINELKGLPIK